MLSSRLSQLPSGVRELVSGSARTGVSRALLPCQTGSGALTSRKSLEQRRNITMEQLNEGRDSMYRNAPDSKFTNGLVSLLQEVWRLISTSCRQRACCNPREWMGRLYRGTHS